MYACIYLYIYISYYKTGYSIYVNFISKAKDVHVYVDRYITVRYKGNKKGGNYKAFYMCLIWFMCNALKKLTRDQFLELVRGV